MRTKGQDRRESFVILYIIYLIITTCLYVKGDMAVDNFFLSSLGFGIVCVLLTMLEFDGDDRESSNVVYKAPKKK